jgi:AcrR family transcriptional regulator
VSNTVERRPGRRAEREPEERRDEILDAATELFAEQGYSDANTQDLADRLGVGKGTVFRHFPTKRDLFLAAVDRVMWRLRAAVDVSVQGIDDPLRRIATAVRACLAFFAEHPRYVELIVQERALFKDRTKPTYGVWREKNIARWAELYRDLIAEGRVRDIPPERISCVIGDLIYGTIFTNYFAGRCRPPDEQADDLLDIVFHGILTDSERARPR